MPPKLNRKRALFVLTKIDEILAWEKKSEAERDSRFVELRRYLCEVRAGVPAGGEAGIIRRFPTEALPGIEKEDVVPDVDPRTPSAASQKGTGTQGVELAKLSRRDRQHFACAHSICMYSTVDCATWLHKARALPKEDFRRAVEKELTGKEEELSTTEPSGLE